MGNESGAPDGSHGWRALAACKGRDTNLFYPINPDSVSKAKAICASCPVRAACLEYALKNNEKNGVWGGLSPKERIRIIRQRRRAAARAVVDTVVEISRVPQTPESDS